MPDIREIRNHMKGVRDTEKLTQAMHMIALSKMRKAKNALDVTRPYFDAIRLEIYRIFENADIPNCIYIEGSDEEARENITGLSGRSYKDSRTRGIIVITSNKGLAGNYNHAAVREAERLLEETSQAKEQSILFLIGEYGRRYFSSRNVTIAENFAFSPDNPNVETAAAIATRMLDEYESGRLCEIDIVYTDMVNSMVQTVGSDVMLPFAESDVKYVSDMISSEKYTHEMEYYPNAETVLKNTVKAYITGYIYGALVDCFCSEQNARMNAMDEANHNAEEIMSSLNLQYNHARQGKITQEITEISSGARALKRKQKPHS